MILKDNARTTINVANVCWCYQPGEAQMQGTGGMIVRFTGGGSTELFEYKDPETLDADLKKIQSAISDKDMGIQRLPVSDTGPR